MIAILTDKPNVGKELARIVGAYRPENGFMSGSGYIVTWTFGNMLSLAMPKDYGSARLGEDDFPLVPERFRLMVKHVKTENGWIPDACAVKQLKVLERVLAKCGTIIAATDASRDGEMAFRYVYRHLGCTQPVKRLWITSLTDEAVRKGLDNLQPMRMYDGLFTAADCRNKADWTLGVNASYTICKATGLGNHSLGRVQTPVLAAVCRRYRERERHSPADTWPVYVNIHKDGTLLRLRCADTIHDKEEAMRLHGECKIAGKATVLSVTSRTEETGPPLPYNLAELQKDANRRYGLTAGQVHDIAQSLYEKKLITYPRTSGRHIPGDVLATLPRIIKKVSGRKELGAYLKSVGVDAGNIDTGRLRPCDTGGGHHAILVTGTYPDGLDKGEMQVYSMVFGRMLEAFMPTCKVEHTRVEASCAGRKFVLDTSSILESGWQGISGHTHGIVPQGSAIMDLPPLTVGEEVQVSACSVAQRKGLPPEPMTDAELVEFMDAHRLGTAATRTAIMQTLVDRKYVRHSGKYIIPTPKGLFVYETFKGMKIADAALTSDWEERLEAVENGSLCQKEFLRMAADLTAEVTEDIFRRYRKGA